MIEKLIIKNFKIFKEFDIEFNENLNIIVGNNEAGKSTILEAINLGLTSRIGGRHVTSELSPFLFHKETVSEYVEDIQKGNNPVLPEIFVEIYLKQSGDDFANLIGTHNSLSENTAGVRLEVSFDEEFSKEYAEFIKDPSKVTTIPAEYYAIKWNSFAGNGITTRSIGIGTSFIDATTIRLQNGADFYLQNIINSELEPKDKVALSIVYRGLKESFNNDPLIQVINQKLVEQKGVVTDKDLSVSVDISQQSRWETNLIPYLDALPFQLIGKGEQNALKILMALDKQLGDSHVVLIEEPENHLSFASMNRLIGKIKEKCDGKQVIISTHSAYVVNKLGLENLILLNKSDKTRLDNLPVDTQNYFKKLSGYDTLRVVLSKKSILVEGPSDELIVQRAYVDKHGHVPIEDEIDIINVRGLSFKRFLDISVELKNSVVVITDNDGDFDKKVKDKYSSYTAHSHISVHSSTDNSLNSLEPNIVAVNELDLLNKVLGTHYTDKDKLLSYMEENKADCALKIFDSEEKIVMPDYIENAIS
jgi:putative ATP-dependent endonuclease of OLD family